MGDLGLTDLETDVYRSLLRESDSDLGEERGAVVAAVARLAELELVELDPDGRPVAIDPDVAVPSLIRRRMRETTSELGRIASAWATLTRLREDRSGVEQTESVERIDTASEVDERIWSLARDAYEILAIHPYTTHIRRTSIPRYLDRLRDDVQWRTIIHRDCLTTPETIDYYTTLHRAGDRHRFTSDSIQQMIVIDRVAAFVPTIPNQSGVGALVIRQPGTVATLVDLFDQVWSRAADLEPEAHPPLTGTQRQVLDLLNRTDKDETAARRMGVSLRTYRRHVADLLAHFGATTRFQVAVIAKEQGWL
jgi:sugar-specific transcriptional regulator TrmB/DNA-binding CsgD family transcriptional regulator